MSKCKIKEKASIQINVLNLAIVLVSALAVVCIILGSIVIVKLVVDSNILHMR